MLKARITTVGNSAGIVLSKEVLSKLRAEKGDDLFLIETPNGYEIVAYDPEFEKQMLAAGKIRKKRKNLMHLLSKS
jgi:putative addiction module antidote